MKTLVIIPSRLSATRLPGKPLLKIKGLSMISHVFKKAEEASIGEVVVAAEDQEIIDDVKQNGGQAILTKNHHKTGTDRIYEAYKKLKKKTIDYVLNLQGDEPMIDVRDIINLNKLAIQHNSDIGTLAAEIKEDKILKNKNVVKVVKEKKLENNNFAKALNFSRQNILKENVNIYHHIGIYCYKVSALEKFVNLNQTNKVTTAEEKRIKALNILVDFRSMKTWKSSNKNRIPANK